MNKLSVKDYGILISFLVRVGLTALLGLFLFETIACVKYDLFYAPNGLFYGAWAFIMLIAGAYKFLLLEKESVADNFRKEFFKELKKSMIVFSLLMFALGHVAENMGDETLDYLKRNGQDIEQIEAKFNKYIKS